MLLKLCNGTDLEALSSAASSNVAYLRGSVRQAYPAIFGPSHRGKVKIASMTLVLTRPSDGPGLDPAHRGKVLRIDRMSTPPPRPTIDPGPGRWRHDLRIVRGTRGACAEEGAGCAEATVNLATESARIAYAGGDNMEARLRRAVRDAGYEPRSQCRGRQDDPLGSLGRFCAGGHRPPAVSAPGAADAGRPVRPALDVAGLAAVAAGHARAVHFGCPFSTRLAGTRCAR
jgi:hypothetical protein